MRPATRIHASNDRHFRKFIFCIEPQLPIDALGTLHRKVLPERRHPYRARLWNFAEAALFRRSATPTFAATTVWLLALMVAMPVIGPLRTRSVLALLIKADQLDEA
jgi:hypothetical protein